MFGTAVVGGIIVDSFTPTLQKKGGKGVLGGGKNSGEVKYGTYQVLVGEGERFWNAKINDPEITGTTIYTLQDPTDDLLHVVERADLRAGKSVAYDRDTYGYSQSFDSGSNTLTATLTTPVNVPSGDTRGHMYYFLDGGWTIPTIDLPSFNGISVRFSPSADANVLSYIGLAFEQNGRLYFRGISFDAPFWYGGTNGVMDVSVTRSNMLSTNNAWIPGDPLWSSGTGLTMDLSEGASPITVYIFFSPNNGGTTIVAGQQNIITLPNTEIIYSAGARNNRGLLALDKIWMNDEIWYNAETTNAAQLEKNDENEQYFTFYEGSLSQLQDPSLVALRGADKVPGLQGYSHLVFHNLPLNPWSNNYPTVKVQVTSTLDATPEFIIRDTLFRAGARYNKPLIEGKDWNFALNDDGTSAFDTTSYSGVTIDGYVAKYDSSDLKNILSEVAQIFRFGIASNSILNGNLDDYIGFTPGVSPLYKVIPTTFTKTIDVEAEVLGTSEADEDTLPWPTSIEGKSADEIPGQVEVQYYNLHKGGERESVLVDRATFQLGGNYTFNPNYHANRRVGTANSIAKFIIYQGLARAKQTIATSFPNQFTGLGNLVAWDGELTLRPQKLMLGADGVYEVTGITISDEDLQEEFVADVIDDLQDPSSIAVDVDVVWTEGQSILAPATGNRRTIYGWLAPPASSSIANESSILISYDGGSFGTTSVNAAAANAQQVTINSIPTENLSDFRYYNIDTESTISVTVPEGIELLSVDLEFILEGTKNILYIQNYGFVGFQTATLTATNTYDLTNLFWNVGQGLIDEGWRTSQTATTGLLLLGQPYEIEIPTSVPKGTPISLVAATAGSNSTTFTRNYEALNSSPRHVTNFNVLYNDGNQDVSLSWIPYIDQDTQLLPSLFADPTVTGDTYTVIIREGASILRTETGINVRGYDYTEALQTTDGVVDRANLTYEVIQEGDINTMDNSVVYNASGEIASV